MVLAERAPGLPVPAVPRVLLSDPAGGRSPLLEDLRAEGLAVLVAPTGLLLQQAAAGAVDLVLLHADGDTAVGDLAGLRAATDLPVLVALRSGAALEAYLEAGADDCVAAGAGRVEVAARARAVLRRRTRPRPVEVLSAGPLVLDTGRRVFLLAGAPVHLPPKEFGLLELLVRREGRVVTREEALALVWGRATSGDPSTVDVHVKRLRAKLEDDPAHPARLLTVRGLGYRLEP